MHLHVHREMLCIDHDLVVQIIQCRCTTTSTLIRLGILPRMSSTGTHGCKQQ